MKAKLPYPLPPLGEPTRWSGPILSRFIRGLAGMAVALVMLALSMVISELVGSDFLHFAMFLTSQACGTIIAFWRANLSSDAVLGAFIYWLFLGYVLFWAGLFFTALFFGNTL